MATASDLRYYAIPDLRKKLAQLEEKKREEDASTGGGQDTVTAEQIAEIVARWTSIPVTRLLSTEREKLLRVSFLEPPISQSICYSLCIFRWRRF